MFLLNFLVFFYKIPMSKEVKLKKIEDLKRQASDLKREVEYYNALQTGLKLVLNGSYA
jgi:hypothetical protein